MYEYIFVVKDFDKDAPFQAPPTENELPPKSFLSIDHSTWEIIVCDGVKIAWRAKSYISNGKD